MALIPSAFLDAVVAIGVGNNPSERRWVGTGLIYGLLIATEADEQKNYDVHLVTNTHVLTDHAQVWLKFNSSTGVGSTDFPAQLIDEDGTPLWSAHPTADVAAVGINHEVLREAGSKSGIFLSDRNVTNVKGMKEHGATEGDGVFLLGFPMGLVDAGRQYVIVRAGCLARVRDLLAGLRTDFLVDALVFPGNSGGPVLSRPELAKLQGTSAMDRTALIGIVSGYIPYRDVAISPQTNRPRVIFEENSGLATVLPTDVIEEVARIERERRLKFGAEHGTV